MADSKVVCPVCVRKVLDSDQGLQCDSDCDRWFHRECVKVTKADYDSYAKNAKNSWKCTRADCLPVADSPLQKLTDIVATLATQVGTLSTKLDDLKIVKEGIENIAEDLKGISVRLSSLEPRVAAVEERMDGIEEALKSNPNTQAAYAEEEIIEEFNERARRARNVIVFGVRESDSDDAVRGSELDKTAISHILSTINPEVLWSPKFVFRIGKKTNDRVRPIKLVFSSVDIANKLLKESSKSASTIGTLQGISFSNDRTQKEREYLEKLRKSLKQRIESGEKDLTIRYMNGVPKIVMKKN